MAREIPHDHRQAHGTWWIDSASNEVVVSCPECGAKASLAHSVDERGEVSPSLACPGQAERVAVVDPSQEPIKSVRRIPAMPPCGFHDHVILLDWPKGWRIDHA